MTNIFSTISVTIDFVKIMSGTQTPTSNSALPTASGYFIDQKKGEVNELKQVTFALGLHEYDHGIVLRY